MSNNNRRSETKVLDQADIHLSLVSKDGSKAAVYNLHRSVLKAHSHYFNEELRSLHGKKFHVEIIDDHNVFPHIVRYMYEGRTDFPADKKVQICFLALALKMYQLLHIAKEGLNAEQTKDLIRYLDVARNDFNCSKFYHPIADCLARRLNRESETVVFHGAPADLMLIILRSPYVPLDKMFLDMRQYVKQYLVGRRRRYAENISLKTAAALENLGSQLNELQSLISKFERIYQDKNKSVAVPQRAIRDIRTRFYEQLDDCPDVYSFRFNFPREKMFDYLMLLPTPVDERKQFELSAPLQSGLAAQMLNGPSSPLSPTGLSRGRRYSGVSLQWAHTASLKVPSFDFLKAVPLGKRRASITTKDEPQMSQKPQQKQQQSD